MIVVKVTSTENKIIIKKGDDAIAKQFALASQASAIAAGESETNAGASEQVATQKAAQTVEDAASALASKEAAESAANASGLSATVSNAAKVLSEAAKVIATQQATISTDKAVESAASAFASEAAKNLSVSAKDTAISKASEANSSSITATTQAGISTAKAVESAASALAISLAQNIAFRGGATLATIPNLATGPQTWQATVSGTYANMGGLVVNLADGVIFLNYDGTTWRRSTTPISLSGINNLKEYLRINNDDLISFGKNLFNEVPQNKTSGYLNNFGAIVTSPAAFITNHIPIIEGITYAYQGFYAASTKFCTYDVNKNFIAAYPVGEAISASGLYTANQGEFFIRFSVRNSNEFMLEIGNAVSAYSQFSRFINPLLLQNLISRYKDLKVVAFGDSITVLPDNWTTSFMTITGNIDLINMGRSGQKICWRAGTVETTNPPIDMNDNNVFWNSILRYQSLHPTRSPDIIIIALGSNDISQGSPLGTYSAAFAQTEALTSQQTMAGAFRKAVYKLSNIYPNAQIFYCSPIQSKTGGRTFLNLSSVRDINFEITERMNVKNIDCLHLSGIQEEFENVGTAGRYLYDGVHPSAAGALMQAKSIAKEFEKLYYFAT